jgi:hypothetical protein
MSTYPALLGCWAMVGAAKQDDVLDLVELKRLAGHPIPTGRQLELDVSFDEVAPPGFMSSFTSAPRIHGRRNRTTTEKSDLFAFPRQVVE